MRGLLLRLRDDRLGFWDVFGPVRDEFIRYHWCFPWQPFMGGPPGFWEDDAATVPLACPNKSAVDFIWTPYGIDKYGHSIWEEQVSLWALDHRRHEPLGTVEGLRARNYEEVVATKSVFWLEYFDSTCWECFVESKREWTLEFLIEHGRATQFFEWFSTRSDQRGRAFAKAGLQSTWDYLNK